MMNATMHTVLLIITASYAVEPVNVAPGIFSKKVTSIGLNLPATNTFSPVNALTTTVHLTKSYSVFVYYQFGLHTLNTKHQNFYSKLLVNDNNAGSLVHTEEQKHITPTGFWKANLNAGHYSFEIHYKSHVDVKALATWDWQGAVLQVM